MQTIGIDENKKKGFWARQFQKEPTETQYKFDWIFGVVLPVVCIFFDPVFFSARVGTPLFGTFQIFVYCLSFTGIVTMMAWLIWGKRLKWLNAFIAGLFLTCGAVALIIGVFVLPYSLMGLIILIGALGFTPLFTGIVYLRNGVRAVGAAEQLFSRKTLIYTVILSVLASGIIPYVINVEVNRRWTNCPSKFPNLFEY